MNILESGGVLVIDEIENGLHLSLAKEIIGLFTYEESNPNHAQLICTSHQPLLKFPVNIDETKFGLRVKIYMEKVHYIE